MKIMRTSKIAQVTMIAGLLLAWCAAASAQDIRYNFLQGTDFSKYKTYKWVQIPNVQYPNSIMDDQIKRAIDAQLALKGLSKTEENPDLYVTYQVAAKDGEIAQGFIRSQRENSITLFDADGTMALSVPADNCGSATLVNDPRRDESRQWRDVEVPVRATLPTGEHP